MGSLSTWGDFPITLSQRLYDAVRTAHYTVADTLMTFGTQNGKGDFLDISKEGEISWRPLGRIEYNQFGEAVDPWRIKGRVYGRPAKALKSFLSSSGLRLLTDRDWEIFSNRFLAQNTEAEFKIVDGEDIRRLYLWDAVTTAKRVPVLSGSCMRYDYCQPYLDLYAKNPNKVQMLVKMDAFGKIEGRSLIWKADNGETFLDRIYADNNDIESFKKYAEEQNWWYRTHNTYSYPSMVMVDGHSRRRYLRVTLDHVPNQYPFCDTMLWFARYDGVVGNSKTALRGYNGLVKLRNTRGGYTY